MTDDNTNSTITIPVAAPSTEERPQAMHIDDFDSNEPHAMQPMHVGEFVPNQAQALHGNSHATSATPLVQDLPPPPQSHVIRKSQRVRKPAINTDDYYVYMYWRRE